MIIPAGVEDPDPFFLPDPEPADQIKKPDPEPGSQNAVKLSHVKQIW